MEMFRVSSFRQVIRERDLRANSTSHFRTRLFSLDGRSQNVQQDESQLVDAEFLIGTGITRNNTTIDCSGCCQT